MWNLECVGVGGSSQGFVSQLAMAQVAAKAAMHARICIALVNIVSVAWDQLDTGERLDIRWTVGKNAFESCRNRKMCMS